MIRIHPTTVLFAFLFLINGFGAHFTALFTALLWHESGHLLMLKLHKVPIRSCSIYPYGGEITYVSQYTVPYNVRFWIAFGGPLFSAIGYIFCMRQPFLFFEYLTNAHAYLLFINLLPIWPLDGGRMITSLLLRKNNGYVIVQYYYLIALLLWCGIVVLLFIHLPQTVILLGTTLVIGVQLLERWINRKYSTVLEKTLIKELTHK